MKETDSKPQDSKPGGDRKAASAKLETMRKRFSLAQDGARENQENYREDTRFCSSSDQWPAEVRALRGKDRIALTFNRLNGVIKQIVGDYRQNKLAIKVRPAGGESSEEMAEIIAGLIRNIESISQADIAYATALECALRGGFGYWRVMTRWAADDVFEQDIIIKPIMNPLSVLFDPEAVLPTREDAQYAFLSEMVLKDDFTKAYPKARPESFTVPGIDPSEMLHWRSGESVRVTEYFEKEKYKGRLALLSNGVTMHVDNDEQLYALSQIGVTVTREREAERTRIRWTKATGGQILEESTLPIRYIPIVPVIGEQVIMDGKTLTRSAIYYSKDAQHMYNYWKTQATEMIALAPKTKWLLTQQHIEGYEQQWERANVDPTPFLLYNPDTEAGGAPREIQPTAQPIAEISMALGASDDIKATTGIFDASLGAQGNETSGKAIMARAHQGSLATATFHDNLAKAIEYCGRIIVDWMPHVYDTERVVRVLDMEDRVRTETINKREYDPFTGITKVLNNVTTGKYDIVVTAGPNFASQRMEAMDGMIKLLQTAPQIWPVAGDLIVKNLDWPGADEIAERIRRSMPPQITVDPDSEEGQQMQAEQQNQPPPIPPEVQAQQAQAERQQMEFEQKMEMERFKAELNHQSDMKKAELSAAVEREKESTRQMRTAGAQPSPSTDISAALQAVAEATVQTMQATQAIAQLAAVQTEAMLRIAAEEQAPEETKDTED